MTFSQSLGNIYSSKDTSAQTALPAEDQIRGYLSFRPAQNNENPQEASLVVIVVDSHLQPISVSPQMLGPGNAARCRFHLRNGP